MKNVKSQMAWTQITVFVVQAEFRVMGRNNDNIGGKWNSYMVTLYLKNSYFEIFLESVLFAHLMSIVNYTSFEYI